MRTLLTILFGAAMLAGCATPADQAAAMQKEAENMKVVFGPACEKLGYTPDTDKWRDCVMQFAMKEDLQKSNRPYSGDCASFRCYRR